MLLEPIWALFSQTLFPIPSTPRLFNPYCRQTDPNHDLPHAHQIRRDNLRRYLASYQQPPSLLIIGEAPGWRGCRFSGVPFTSEAQLCADQIPFTGQRSSRGGDPCAESSATLFWRLMRPHHPRFLAWNCVPFHPRRPDAPLTNRPPTRAEIKAHAPLLTQLLSLLSPIQVVALGRSAQRALEQIGVPATYIRHPSHGGARQFQAGMARILGTAAASAASGRLVE